MNKNVKGQLGYIIKPLALVAIIILLIFLIYTLYTSFASEKLGGKSLDVTATATNILLILANSEDCLAFKTPITSGAYANVIDVNKLDEFSSKYADIEPECARNYDFGWRVEVKEITRGGATTKSWSFGAKDFSTGKALKNKVTFWIPVAIRYTTKNVQPGKMFITLVDGELEKIAGFLDWSCKMGILGKMSSSTMKVGITYPITYNKTQKLLCSGKTTCRKLFCNLVSFEDMKSAGTYSISSSFRAPNRLFVSV